MGAEEVGLSASVLVIGCVVAGVGRGLAKFCWWCVVGCGVLVWAWGYAVRGSNRMRQEGAFDTVSSVCACLLRCFVTGIWGKSFAGGSCGGVSLGSRVRCAAWVLGCQCCEGRV